MAKRLTKRTVVETPKPLPSRGKETPEPETVLCQGAETPKAKYAPILGICIECGRNPANSALDNLCLNCHNDKHGFVFDEDSKRFKKEKKK